jgi:membrane associated rhomboid family serine protease
VDSVDSIQVSEVVSVPAEATAILRTRLERRAMDWSLVLVSQGIPVSLDRDPTVDQGWTLTVAASDLERSRALIRQFRLENRGFGWRQELPGSGLLFHRGVLAWVAAVAAFAMLGDSVASGQFLSPAVRAGEWWRAFTAMWLHADPGHLGSNVAVGTVVIGLAMARHGAGWALLLAGLAGAAANGIGLHFRPGAYTGLGASGLVMAALGQLIPRAWPWWRAGRRQTRLALGAIAAGIFLFLLLGTDPSGDVLVHAAGFLLGLLGGLALVLIPERLRRKSDLGAGIVFVLINALCWFLALRH